MRAYRNYSGALAEKILAIRVDKASATPVYTQIAAGVRGVIGQMAEARGMALPPERVLCERFGVSRMTLRQALDVLVREGLINQERGRGTFVTRQRLEKQQQEFRSFSEEIAARGARPSSRLISLDRAPADEEAREVFGPDAGDGVYRIVRVRLADGTPLAVETVRIPVRLCPDLERYSLEDASLYDTLDKVYGLQPSQAVEEIAAGLAGAVERKLLGLPRPSPVLIIRRQTFTGEGDPVELTTAVIRGDLYRAMVRSSRASLRR